MEITISGHHMEVGESLSNHVELKLGAVVRKYFADAINAHVVFEKRNSFFKSEINLHEGAHKYAFSRVESDDAYKAFAAALHKIEHQLQKEKEKQKGHH